MTNKYIEQQIRQSVQLMLFLPDNFSIKSLSRGFIFTLIHRVKPDLYAKMQEIVKEQKRIKKQKKYSQYEMDVKGEFAEELEKMPMLEVIYII